MFCSVGDGVERVVDGGVGMDIVELVGREDLRGC